MNGWRWPYFKPEEILSPEGLHQYLQRNVLLVQPILLDKLELFRQQLEKPLLINHNGLQYRGYRSPRENYEIVKGEKYSFHMQGLAADISVSNMTTLDLFEAAIKCGFNGVGFYPQKKFVHVDMRANILGKPVTWII